jgi:hypothetical protein
MTKRIQIPISDQDRDLLAAAARRARLPLAEWARAHLRRKAQEEIGRPKRSPAQAAEALCSLGAPVADVETMIEESCRGRFE